MTHTGEQEISAVPWRLPDNLGELACMTYMYFINVSFKWNNIFTTKFLDELSSQQVVDHLNKFSNACLKDVSYDADDTVKDLSDVVFSVAEVTLPVKSGLPVLKKPKNSRKRKNKWFDI